MLSWSVTDQVRTMTNHRLLCFINVQYISNSENMRQTGYNRVEMIPSYLYEDFPSKVNTLLSLSRILAQGYLENIYRALAYCAPWCFFNKLAPWFSTFLCRNGLNNVVIRQGIIGTCSGMTQKEWDWSYEESSSIDKDEKRPCIW
jgi:hypothetical protein